MPLSQIPEGTLIFNIEQVPGDGGSIVRASGGSAAVVSRDTKEVIVKMPSKKTLIDELIGKGLLEVIEKTVAAPGFEPGCTH